MRQQKVRGNFLSILPEGLEINQVLQRLDESWHEASVNCIRY